MNDKNCIVLFHLPTGDNFTVYALISKLSEKYDKLYIFCLDRNKLFVKQLYENHKNVNIIYIEDKKYNIHLVTDDIFNKYCHNIKNYDLIKLGHHDIISLGNQYWRSFYNQANVNYDIRYDYMNINRKFENENKLYQKIINIYGDKYIFVHDHRHISYKHFSANRKDIDNIKNVNIPIFHPNINYYDKDKNNKYYNLWNESLISNNILDYGMIIENASEIHINDSSFSCLCPYLNLDHIKIKKIYTNINYKDYHNKFNDWEIINY